MKGTGNKEYTKMLVSEGYQKSKIEAKGNERYLIYFGRVHMEDIDTGLPARGHMKIGRGKFMTALMRGRNQPGVDFRVYAELIVDTNDDTKAAEAYIKSALSDRNVKMSQGQREMYKIADDELTDIVSHIHKHLTSKRIAKVKEVNFYVDGVKTSI